ncbi:ferredoxin [Agarivorans sp. MS3-6]|uniref:ferredoxin n=1 Tax=Agarivorans sp. TSD2052 TaxID=2937286 RepID=UPI00200E4602|nr:ferredoxin [Agarivorans sp. TSD2052]UPW20368.1 ferredoxin [Agarivorans sp. TSD2052]
MALSITQACIGCFACKEVCPKNAVTVAEQGFMIVEHRCDECRSNTNGPQCGQICPVETAITDNQGRALNPPGSLSGIPQKSHVIAMTK